MHQIPSSTKEKTVGKRSTFKAQVIFAIVMASAILAGYAHVMARILWQYNLDLVSLNPVGPLKFTLSDSGYFILESDRTFWNYNPDMWGLAFTHSVGFALIIVAFYMAAWMELGFKSMNHSLQMKMLGVHFVNPRVYALHPAAGNEPYMADDPQWRNK